ncbi:uncharacterized protein LOC133181832 [Saccostrea echinata]|uniref:uncharacterized protein LOC133181832 n=1 Tax=Saccostrea echinata TaxID=191078 RepID=UPI002A826088|nr:uncharacterized protein LOC133181832 [Saccostrea echinata]
MKVSSGIFRWITCFYLIFCFLVVHSERHKGTWSSSDFLLFVSKFGVQKTDLKNEDATQGFFYGNISTTSNSSNSLTLVVVDSEYFSHFYGNATSKLNKQHKTSICKSMFKTIDQVAYDKDCKPEGTKDYLRRVPCPKNKLCVDEDTPSNVVPNYQFTYKIMDKQIPRYWYMSIVACYRNTTNKNCSWVSSDDDITIDYDIWLVNGDPIYKNWNPVEHQFSFEEHDIFETFLGFLGIYIIIVPFWFYVYSKQRHSLTKFLLLITCTEAFGIFFNFIHVAVFASNGVGVYWIAVAGNAIDIIAQCLFMLSLLLLAKGWMITQPNIWGRKVVFSLWGVYTLLNCVLFLWNLFEVDVISNKDEWQTWPGYLICGFRIIIMIWFIFELRHTFLSSRCPEDRLQFLQQFGAYFLVWFIYLPVLVILNTQFSALWKKKIMLCITNGADLLSYLILLHLLWPSRSILYLLKGEEPIPYDLLITGVLDEDQDDKTIFRRKKTKLNGHLRREKNHNTIKNGFQKSSNYTDEKRLALLPEEEEEEEEL